MRSDPSIRTGETAGSESVRRIARKRLPTAVTLLVAAFALVGVVVAGTGAVAADGTADLDADVVTVGEDGTAEIPVETDGVDAFEVVVGGEEEAGYELRATVTPDGDGVTTLVFDHARTGGGGATLTADGGAEVETDYETSLSEEIAPGSYDAEVLVGGDTVDVGTLVVEDATGGEGENDGSDGDDADGSDGDDADGSDGDDADGSDGDDADDADDADGSDGGSAEPATVTEADVEAADIVVAPAESEVSVPVAVDDGETVNLRIRSAGDASPAFLMTEEASVENGTASATFDLSRTSHGDRATLTVRGNEAVNESDSREVLIVDEEVGVEGSGGLDLETPGFGVVAGGLAVLAVTLAARRRE
ncbi:hypothetical protein DJ73_04465 [Halorubrum sp. Ea1]|uniref:BGTF surface domain-containing protein n=1 Tax=Halorubrum sp. Ea1 TaxID=1480718 RepID=UPI000BCBD9F8|nr:BGTF surface domain-containing protein [Halorubrum sp. Ea1]OYR54757.1 hypothetical protein DJ73_04465 [Halorubrum sp. Ea1]